MTARTVRRLAVAALVLPLAWVLYRSAAPLACSRAVAQPMKDAWALERAGNRRAAAAGFESVLRRCPGHIAARTGLGYVALHEGRTADARHRFEAVLAEQARNPDALLGLGIAAWREGDLEAVHAAFTKLIAYEPDNATAREYLARLPAGLGSAPNRPPLIRPDTVVYPARTHGDRFEVRTASGWQPFYIKGINLGAALPGKHPSEFPDSATYTTWIREMAAMGTNSIRVYTIHPPHFYSALAAWNRTHANRPLWLVQGVWTELPPEHNFRDPQWEAEFFTEMRHVADLLHGRADIQPRPGHAGGFYTADVSPWVLAYIIGREWEPLEVVGFNRDHPSETEWRGQYLRVRGTPMDAWVTRASEYLIAYEMAKYHAQRPIAYTNWPTLDPLHHPTETTVQEEIAIRTARGEHVGKAPLEYDNDATGLDAALVHATTKFPAGFFASYHAYPYYPDFMVLDPGYNAARGPFGRSNYWGYLTALKRHHPNIPVVIAEYGVPASIGSAHLQPQGWHHGGLTEAQMAAADARLTREIADAGLAGGMLFAWIDEWFKKNWIVIDFEIPLERNRLWLNGLDAEQHYGMIAMDAKQAVSGATAVDRFAAWQRQPALYRDAAGGTLRAAADAAYLWLLYQGPTGRLPDEALVGFDVIDSDAGDFRWPARVGGPVPIGLEFVLRLTADGARLVADPSANPLTAIRSVQRLPGQPVVPAPVEDALPGFFTGRWQQSFNRPYRARANASGVYAPLRVVTNRRRFARDSTEYAAYGYDRGILREGPLPDGAWERLPERGAVEVRIPWMLLNFTDPSMRRVLQDPPGKLPGDFGTETVQGIRLVAAARVGGTWAALPRSGARRDVASFTWPTWEQPQWRARRRPVFDTMRHVFTTLHPPVLQQNGAPP